MCNPRKNTARATRQITEAWRAAIERTDRLGDTVSGRAELTQPLGSMLAEPARRAFEQAVVADPRWQLHDGAYDLDVQGGQAHYWPDSGELEISVELSAYVEVEGAATRVVEGIIEETVEASAEAGYYDDGAGGRTRARAEQEADALAEEEAERKAQLRAASARRKARKKADSAMQTGDDVQQQAEAEARSQLATERSRRGEELNRDAQELLDRVQQQSLRGIWETVALGYQNALLSYAESHGARNIDVSRSGGSVQIQFQMEA